jgi:putative hydrolase of the HAD superfamily
VPKEHPEFWSQLQAQLAFDPSRCLFVDDSIPVLNAARAHGIGQIFAIACPDSTQHARRIEGFDAVERVECLLSG